MATVFRNLIEYVGISTKDDIPEDVMAYKQFNIEENLKIPCRKPEIEQILKVIAEVEITSTRIIETPKGTSLEGQILTGWKVIIEGNLIQKIQYVADCPEQPTHAAEFEVPFSTFVVLSEDFQTGFPVFVDAYIEDIYVEQIGKKQIFKNVTVLVTAQIC